MKTTTTTNSYNYEWQAPVSGNTCINACLLNLGDLCIPVRSRELVYIWTGGKLKMAAQAAADGWRMEPFIQLTYAEKCPKRSLHPAKTSFIDKSCVTKHFWLDLLETKCLGGSYLCFICGTRSTRKFSTLHEEI